MSLVVDSSVTLAWVYEDERHPASDAILDIVVEKGAVVPSLWHLEVANGLQTSVRRRRISEVDRNRALAHLISLDIEIDLHTTHHAWSDTLALSTRFGLTVYDAAYLELASRRKLPLASLDRELRLAGEASGVPLLGL